MNLKFGGATYSKSNLFVDVNFFKSADYDFIEIDLGLPILPNKEFENEFDKVRKIIPIKIGHLPEVNFKEDDLERCKKFIKLLSKKGVGYFVIHLFSLDLSTKDNFNLKIDFLKKLAFFAKRNKSKLLLENTEEKLSILKKVFSLVPELYFCLDVGHANLFSKENRSIGFIKYFSKILKHIHMHDNFGGNSEKDDLHLSIGKGNINFLQIFKELKKINYLERITLEIHSSEDKTREESLRKAREILSSIK